MNRIIMIPAKSKKDFDSFIEDTEALRPFIESELDKMRIAGDDFCPRAIAYRRFLCSQMNWREKEKSL